MKKISKILIVSGVIVVVAGLGYWRFRASRVKYETATVDQGSVVAEVSVTGSLQPVERLSLEPQVAGQVVKVNVTEGDQVKAGDALVALDDSDVQARIQSQRAAIASAQAQLDQLLAGATTADLALSQSSVNTAAAKLDAAKQAVSDATQALADAGRSRDSSNAKDAAAMTSKVLAMLDDFSEANTSAGDAMNRLDLPLYASDGQLAFSANNDQAIANAVATRVDAFAALDELGTLVTDARAAGTYDAATGAYDGVMARLHRIKTHLDASAAVLPYALGLSSTEMTTDQANVGAAQTAINAAIDKLVADQSAIDVQNKVSAADAALADISVSNAKTALNAANANLVSATKALAESQAAYDLKKTGTRPEAVAAQRAQVASAQAGLSGLMSDLAKRTITAPRDAVVTDVNVKVGETVQPGTPAVSLDAAGAFEIVSNVSEVDIASVKVGEPVGITLDAFPKDQKWTGKVTKIFPAEKVLEGVIFYETHVLFDENDPRLKSGMTANLTIETQRRDDVLRVPLRAVNEVNGQTTVQVLANGQAVNRTIQTGLEDNDYAEVTGGLQAGDQVVVGTK